MKRAVLLLVLAGCKQIFGLDAPEHEMPDAQTTRIWRSITTGITHTCAIRTDGSLWCWGANYAGQAGAPYEVFDAAPQPVGNATWTQVTAGHYRTCGVQTDGSLWCWGHNAFGQLGDGTVTITNLPRQVAGAWQQASAGADHTCALRSDHSLWCWGGNDYGQLGDGTTVQRRDHGYRSRQATA
ncbi:MAG TPA: hypothetical protein VL326_35560 [Kofleriaceae bacterium]|nr:hypothetical protein [Kofleriaceae bacterium]